MEFLNTSKDHLSFTLANPELEVSLAPGQSVELPETNGYVKTLVGLKKLTPVLRPAKTQTEQPKQS